MPLSTAPRMSVGEAVADGERAAAAELRDLTLRRGVDRRMRLADEDRLAAELVVEPRERAGAVDEPVAALDDDVGIGADHRKPARDEALKQRAVVVRRLGGVVEETGAAR